MRTLKVLVVVACVIAISAFAIDKVSGIRIYNGYSIGMVVDDFNLKNIDNSLVSLSDYKDQKGCIVIFTCNHCPYSVMYEDRIIALDTKFKEKGYPVLAINPNNPKVYAEDSFENMKIRAKEKGFTFPYLVDAEQKVYPLFGATKTPQAYILQNTDKGSVLRYIGAIDNNYKDAALVTTRYVEEAIESLLNDEPVKVEVTKAIGCSIKS